MSQGFTTKRLALAGNGITEVFVNGVKQASTSGACTDGINFTIPSGVKNIKLSLKDVSNDATVLVGLRLGDSGGIQTTGYSGAYSQFSNGTSNVVNSSGSTVWWISGNDAAAYDYDGVIELTLHDAATNTWIVSGQLAAISGTTEKHDTITGSLSLDNELTTVQLYGNTGNWDAGSVNVQYDNPNPTVLSNLNSGAVVQNVYTLEGEYQGGSTLAPQDDTILQNTEGVEMMTCSITPTKATNLLKIEVNSYLHPTSAAWVNYGIFQDSTADALNTGEFYGATGTGGYNSVLVHWMTAGTTDSTTFKFRAGAHTGNIGMNGAGSRRGGGRRYSSITITEYSN